PPEGGRAARSLRYAMFSRLWKRPSHRTPRRHHLPLRLEVLEDRTLLSASPLAAATPLLFGPLGTAQVAHFLATPAEVDLYRVTLNTGDQVSARVSAQTAGSGLQSLLRVFDASGRQVALDDQEGGDPQLTFQAATGGVYFVGISSAGNDSYDPNTGSGATAGGTPGFYTLELRRTGGPPPLGGPWGGCCPPRTGPRAGGGA